MFLSKRELASNFLLNDILHDYVQRDIFAPTSTLPPKATILNTPFSHTRTHYLFVYPIFLALSKSNQMNHTSLVRIKKAFTGLTGRAWVNPIIHFC